MPSPAHHPLAAYARILTGIRRERPPVDTAPSFVIANDDVDFGGARRARYSALIRAQSGAPLPAWPHVLATAMHTRLVADPRFALAPLGLVHVSQRITQHAPLPARGRLEVSLRGYSPHRRGVLCTIDTRAYDTGTLVWEGETTALSPQAKWPTAAPPQKRPPRSSTPSTRPALSIGETLGGGLGRSYSRVSWDWNPIHLHPLLSRPFGFKRPIIHGMWTAARCVTLLGEIGSGEALVARFRRPLPLPSGVRLEAWPDEGVARAVSEDGEQVYVSVHRAASSAT